MAAALLLVCSLTAVAQPPSLQAQDLARKNGCLSCHGMVRKQVGPGFAQIAARYRGDPEAPLRLAGKIQAGSVGTWGRVIMPRQALVTPADAQVLADWVLSQPPLP
ncbi:cytochrome c [Polaromonas sp. OV174]|uniref:c-type cytochrome n=1 Tax=Polaromonas sp. OV174 TaxID=1855300 RepID=UPI0008EC34A8|nr:c-type cytochrome [Polaromonas sp. OV174]SFC02546.1 cytochrome c [Polaromonas sp. OV174]